jgi:hypothetical protein
MAKNVVFAMPAPPAPAAVRRQACCEKQLQLFSEKAICKREIRTNYL